MEREKAIEAIKEAMPTLWKETKEAIQTLIPELAESEDEKIRKEIIDFIQWAEDRGMTRHDYHHAKRPAVWIAYLEKQKEQKPVTFEEPCNSDEYEVVEVGNATCLRRKEQKPEKQFEDNEEKSIGTTLIDALKGNAQLEWELKRAGVDVKRLITHLEQKEQKPVKWSEEDGAKIGTLSAIIFDYAFYKDALDENNDLTGEYAELEDWLECLPERFELPLKQEWGEKEESFRALILEVLEEQIRFCNKNKEGASYAEQIRAAQNWLKSLPKEWKPSEEQMEALHTAAYLPEMEFYGGLKDKLRELYDNLKKL